MKIAEKLPTKVHKFVDVAPGTVFRLTNGKTYYVKAHSDMYGTATNAVSLESGSKQHFPDHKEVYMYPDAILTVGEPL